jgi:predicted DNA-binding ribbon-helix-helix protein
MRRDVFLASYTSAATRILVGEEKHDIMSQPRNIARTGVMISISLEANYFFLLILATKKIN